MKSSLFVALFAVIRFSTAGAQGPCAAADTARVLKELTAAYTGFREAFMKNAPQAWIDALDSSFTLTLFSGAVMPRSWVENYVRTNANQFRIHQLQMDIQAIKVVGDTVTATVQQTSDREFTDDHGVTHRLEVGAQQLETWVCTSTGWRLGHVEEHKLLHLRRDGKTPS